MIHHRKNVILYVDDSVEQRYAMRRILETDGYKILEAGSGAEALKLLKESISLAVVDVKLPDINGYDLTREIKRYDPFLPVLQVSASFSDAKLRASGLSGGADAYIAQPVHPSELTALVRRMLQTVEAEESLRFLAGIGPYLSASLSPAAACENICHALIPHFADRCIVFLKDYPGRPEPFWSSELESDDPHRQMMLDQAEETSTTLVDSRFVLASLFTGTRSFGSIAFFLDSDREYTASDKVVATDLANRVSLALQNCMLFATEQATRTALIHAEKLATAGRMAAAIAHEVNNPLEALTNLIYLLEQSSEATPFIRETASTALGEVTRLAHITRQTLGFYRELSAPAVIDLSQSVLETVDLYRNRMNKMGIVFDLDLKDDLMVRGIKGEIRQVISNLVVNASEAMEAEGIVTIETRGEDDHAVLTIIDNGPGIPAPMLPRIFDAFFTTKQGTGTGLGLWISQNIVEKHDGTIAVSTSTLPDDHGTRFVLKFPLTRAAQ